MRILITTILIFSLSAVFAQPGKIKKGEKLYASYSYSESIEKFEAITDKTTDMKRKLAESYFKIHNYKMAEAYYAELMTADDKTNEDIYNYASVLAINQKYKKSEEWMAIFHKKEKSDSRGKKVIENRGFYKDLQKDKGLFTIFNLGINSAQEDFGVAYYMDKIVFTSSTTGVKPVKRKWNWNNLPFLDLYIAEIDDKKEITEAEKFSKVNKRYHEGPVTFNKAGNYMVFTRNNYKKKSSDGVTKLELFYSEKNEKGKWSKAKPIPFNNPDYSTGHASLNAAGDTMYFASDMPGGIGGVDIYMSVKNSEGVWQSPKNLGKEVNTEGNEMFPFVHKDGFLFFASDGHLGLGGLDIFVAQINDGKYEKIENLGVPVNTSYDDFSFVLDEKQEGGYFASNRTDGKGSDDIYRYILNKPFTKGKLIKGTARDTKGKILASTNVKLFDPQGRVVGEITTTETGAYEFRADADKNYKLTGKKVDFYDGQNFADTHTDEEVIIADLILAKIPEFSLYCLVTNKETGKPLDSVQVVITNNFDKTDSETIVTDPKGDFRRDLENKMNDEISYNLKIKRKGFMSKEITYNKTLDREGEYKIHEELDLTLAPIKIGTNLEDLVDVNPIYFDLGKHNIRPDAALELDKIVKVMNEYPTMVVELGAHTDCRGSSKSNESLSDRRAKSSAQYIKERITNPDRIYGKGYGESKLKIKCACTEGKAHNLTKEQHQLNRRTEFKIIKM